MGIYTIINEAGQIDYTPGARVSVQKHGVSPVIHIPAGINRSNASIYSVL